MKYIKFVLFLTPIFILLALGSNHKVVAGEKKLSKVLNVYNWEDYFGETTLEDFSKKFGVKVNIETFEDEGELVSNLQSHPDKYDVIITSGDCIRELAEMRLLAKINLANISNFKNIERKFRNPHYDPGHRFSVPYLWGTTGIVVNRTFIKGEIDSWSILWNPKYKGKMCMLNNPQEVTGAALKYLGYSLNTNDSDELESARQKVFGQSPLVTGYFDPITIREQLISNELWAAQIYSGEGMFAVDQNKALEYVIPKEGVAIWVDCMAISRDVKHKYTAEVFINYILDPKVSADIANYIWYANCNKAARPYTEKKILNSLSLYPLDETLKKCEFFQPTGTAAEEKRSQQIVNKIWSELQLKKEQAKVKKR